MQIVWQTNLCLADLLDTKCDRTFMLLSDFSVLVGDELLTAPRGMVTDGASVPRIMWRVIGSPFTGRYRWPSVIHDAAYGRCLIRSTGAPVTKPWSDDLYRDLMESREVSPWRRWLMYQAVKRLGTKAWKNGEKQYARTNDS